MELTPEKRAIFGNKPLSGQSQFEPLLRVDPNTKAETPFKDMDYLELLGRKCLALDEEQKAINPNLPTAYPAGYDPECIKLGKAVAEAVDAGRPKSEIQTYINRALQIGVNSQQ